MTKGYSCNTPFLKSDVSKQQVPQRHFLPFLVCILALTTVISEKPHSQNPRDFRNPLFPEGKHPQRGEADKISDKFCQAKYDLEHIHRIRVSTRETPLSSTALHKPWEGVKIKPIYLLSFLSLRLTKQQSNISWFVPLLLWSLMTLTQVLGRPRSISLPKARKEKSTADHWRRPKRVFYITDTSLKHKRAHTPPGSITSTPLTKLPFSAKRKEITLLVRI